MRIAIIDLGTNTSNLLIAEKTDAEIKILHQSKQLVRMGDNKIRENLISHDATERVLSVLKDQQKIIEQEQVEKVTIIATSAVRAAKNKDVFIEAVIESTEYPVEVISGEKEATLIFKGILMALDNLQEKSLILDIGGGSIEMIVAKNKQILWKESKPTGMARIIGKFFLSDPIKQEEIQILQNYYQARYLPAFMKCKEEGVNTLIGCSGTFDTIADIIDQVNPGEKIRRYQNIPIEDFYSVYNDLIHSTRKQRMDMVGMDNVRVDLIVPAVLFIELLIKQTGIIHITHTGYALREGAAYELLNKLEKRG